MVKWFLQKKSFHEFMLRNEGRQWIDFLYETSDPLEKFSIIPHYEGFGGGETFSHIYRKNLWTGSESRSGPGSSLKETEQVRSLLPPLLKKYGIKTFVDIPCGDWNWMKTIDWSDVGVERYFGGDIVSEIIDENKKRFGSDRCEFAPIDLTESPLPPGDLLLCRDCLVHLPYENIEKFLRNLHRSGIRYLLTTTFTNRPSNRDIKIGDWRPLNLESAPFCFPKPLEIIVENSTERQGKDSDKSLGLWEVATLPESLKHQ